MSDSHSGFTNAAGNEITTDIDRPKIMEFYKNFNILKKLFTL